MNWPRALILLLLGLSCFQGCSKSRPPSDSNTAQASTLSLSEKGKTVEERIVNGEAVNESDLQGLASTELRILRNASFARHGRKYDSPGLGDYFSNRSWYKAQDDYNDSLLTAADRANVKLILTAEQRGGTGTTANANSSSASSSNQSPSQSQPVVTTTQPQGGAGQLTTDKVQRAVDKALDWTRKGGGATVSGIQEFPQENAARADVRFDGFQYNANVEGSPVSKDKTTPPEPSINDPRFYEKMTQHGLGAVQVKRFSGRGTAILKHYNDGRWVLAGVQFDFVGVNANIEVR